MHAHIHRLVRAAALTQRTLACDTTDTSVYHKSADGAPQRASGEEIPES